MPRQPDCRVLRANHLARNTYWIPNRLKLFVIFEPTPLWVAPNTKVRFKKFRIPVDLFSPSCPFTPIYTCEHKQKHTHTHINPPADTNMRTTATADGRRRSHTNRRVMATFAGALMLVCIVIDATSAGVIDQRAPAAERDASAAGAAPADIAVDEMDDDIDSMYDTGSDEGTYTQCHKYALHNLAHHSDLLVQESRQSPITALGTAQWKT